MYNAGCVGDLYGLHSTSSHLTYTFKALGRNWWSNLRVLCYEYSPAGYFKAVLAHVCLSLLCLQRQAWDWCHVTVFSSGQEIDLINEHLLIYLKNFIELKMLLSEIKLTSLKAKLITPQYRLLSTATLDLSAYNE